MYESVLVSGRHGVGELPEFDGETFQILAERVVNHL